MIIFLRLALPRLKMLPCHRCHDLGPPTVLAKRLFPPLHLDIQVLRQELLRNQICRQCPQPASDVSVGEDRMYVAAGESAFPFIQSVKLVDWFFFEGISAEFGAKYVCVNGI